MSNLVRSRLFSARSREFESVLAAHAAQHGARVASFSDDEHNLLVRLTAVTCTNNIYRAAEKQYVVVQHGAYRRRRHLANASEVLKREVLSSNTVQFRSTFTIEH